MGFLIFIVLPIIAFYVFKKTACYLFTKAEAREQAQYLIDKEKWLKEENNSDEYKIIVHLHLNNLELHSRPLKPDFRGNGKWDFNRTAYQKALNWADKIVSGDGYRNEDNFYPPSSIYKVEVIKV